MSRKSKTTASIPDSPVICPLMTPTGRRRAFSTVFEYDGFNDPIWRVVGSGVRGWPTVAPNTLAIFEALIANGIEIRDRSMGSPVNASSYHLESDFLDGGFEAETGDYFHGPRGAWIRGKQALEFVILILNLKPPPEHKLEHDQTSH